MNTKSTLKMIFLHASGISATRSALREVRHALSFPSHVLLTLLGMVRVIKEQAIEDRVLAEHLGSEALWDRMVSQYGITTQSVLRGYRSATVLNYLLLIAIAANFGFLLGDIPDSLVIISANLAFLNLLLILLVQNTYRLNMARTQSAPSVVAFIKTVILNPTLLIALPLPSSYRVRGEPNE
ncbi:hypothetical protein FQZ97_335650 [compost metagenome]